MPTRTKPGISIRSAVAGTLTAVLAVVVLAILVGHPSPSSSLSRWQHDPTDDRDRERIWVQVTVLDNSTHQLLPPDPNLRLHLGITVSGEAFAAIPPSFDRGVNYPQDTW
jgi:hypothetical protein